MYRTITNMNLFNTRIKLFTKFSTSITPSQAFQFEHVHSVPELHICLSGTSCLCTKNQKTELHKGSCILIGPNTPHHFEVIPDAPLFRLESMLNIKKPTLPESYSWMWQENLINYWDLDEADLSLAHTIANELRNETSDSENIINGSFMLIFTHLARTLSKASRLSFPSNNTNKDSKTEIYIRDQIATFLKSNYANNITIDDLAAHLTVSTRQAHRLVKLHIGSTFKQYLVYVRMENAKHLLKTTDLTISQISEKLGYEYSSSFCKAFYHQNQISPTMFRTQIRKENKLMDKNHWE